MRTLFRRIWRYLNYLPNIHGKLEEIGGRLYAYFDQMSRHEDIFRKAGSAQDLFQTKAAAIESELRCLRTISVSLQNQVNSIQDHLRSSQPWLPSPEGASRKPEGWLLLSLMSFFPNPRIVNIGTNDEELFELVLEAGFEIYALKPGGPVASKPLERFAGYHGLNVMDAEELARVITEKKDLPAGAAVLRFPTKELESLMVTSTEQLSPEIMDTAFSTLDRYSSDDLGSGRKLIQEMRSLGYRWNLLLFRIYGAPGFRFAANLATVPDMASGHLLFFKNHAHFEQSYRWAQLVLPRFQY